MVTTSQLITADDLWRMPDDGYRYELVRGELRQMSPAGHQHGRIAINITIPLGQYVRANHLGAVYAAETGFRLAPDHVRAPDVAFIRQERLEENGDREGFWPGAPDLAVEVISPSDTYTEVEEKIFDWLEAGTRMVIVVNPRQRLVTVYRALDDIVILTENDQLDGGEVVPGWTMPVHEVFI
jgi:Uma2 family endonuclease